MLRFLYSPIAITTRGVSLYQNIGDNKKAQDITHRSFIPTCNDFLCQPGHWNICFRDLFCPFPRPKTPMAAIFLGVLVSVTGKIVMITNILVAGWTRKVSAGLDKWSVSNVPVLSFRFCCSGKQRHLLFVRRQRMKKREHQRYALLTTSQAQLTLWPGY